MEPLLFIVFLYFFALLAFGRRGWRWWRNYRREQWLWSWTSDALGRPVRDATSIFGPPFEVYRGKDSTLYEWKSPPATSVPKASGLLILYVVADANGVVTHASWQTRGASG